ncbi:LPS-assembly protein LptD [Candidatus Colwellia aromaticivorans]|uniref:LPS-assembly protein LptD n=1 Tax=Candidatus Colwellia aromaticivorans TaxID=2267621 RepID=UPI000DF41C75|nr:LPS assembly protein LptD [Candidatus Colwellia aromaticivorans]
MLFFRQIFSCSVILAIVLPFPAFAITTEQEATEPQLQCAIPTFVPIATDAVQITDDSIRITSKYSRIEKDRVASFSGDVTLIDKSQTITADQLTFDRLLMQFNAHGNIHYQNQSIDILADELNASKDDKSSVMLNTSYQLYGNPGHGSAGELQLNSTEGLSLLDSTYTTCIGEEPDWLIKASEIEISADGSTGEAYHAQVRLFDVPVLYLPYFSFPVSKQRKSGFLYPKIGSSSNSGLEIETPYYWNIAPFMDATFTPHYMSKRGTQLKTEFRYLTELQSGNINIEYLNKDNEITSNDDARYLARLQHVGTFSDDFRAYIDYTTISDDNYLVDIGSKEYNSNDAYLYQVGELSYFGENWQTTMKIQDFEVLGNHQPSYKTLPHIEVLAQQPFSLFSEQTLQGQFELYSELTSFKAETNQQASANRYHVEAGLSFPVSTPAWFLNSEFKLMHTYYQQSDIQDGSELTKNVNRTLPKVRFHGGINFDRTLSWFGNNYTQTIEPQIQYLYIPEEDQADIGLYDTTNLQDDYNGLFRDRSYSGLDRIAGANQYTWGITSRVLDQSNLEIFRLSVGRIQYLSDNNTFDELIDTVDADIDSLTSQQSSVAANLFYRLNHRWQISSDIQYNTMESFTNKSQVSLNYQIDKYNSVQLNHRYTRNVSGSSLEQASVLASFAINKDWAFVGRLTEDLKQTRSLESYAGLQYESCCWAIRVAYHRYINSNLSDDGLFNENRDEFNSGFVLQFIIKGLNGKQGAIGTQEMFDSSIFGYKRPYYLQN